MPIVVKGTTLHIHTHLVYEMKSKQILTVRNDSNGEAFLDGDNGQATVGPSADTFKVHRAMLLKVYLHFHNKHINASRFFGIFVEKK